MSFILPIKFVFYTEAGKLMSWMYKTLPFNLRYSLKLAYLAGRFKKQSSELLLEDINKEKQER